MRRELPAQTCSNICFIGKSKLSLGEHLHLSARRIFSARLLQTQAFISYRSDGKLLGTRIHFKALWPSDIARAMEPKVHCTSSEMFLLWVKRNFLYLLYLIGGNFIGKVFFPPFIKQTCHSEGLPGQHLALFPLRGSESSLRSSSQPHGVGQTSSGFSA